MNTSLAAFLVSACLLAAVGIGIWIRRLLPEHHLNADTKDRVKLALGPVLISSEPMQHALMPLAP